MATEGDTCIVTITYYKSDGSDPVEGSATIKCVAATEKKGDPYFKAAPGDLNLISGCYRFYDPANSTDTNVTVAVGADKLVHFYAQDNDGSAISYDSYEIESADETIASVEIGQATGKWASFTVFGNTKGSVQLTLKATKNGAESIYNIPVTVTEPLAPVKAKVTLTPSKMSNAWDENYDGTVSVAVTAVDGNAADRDLYSVADPELKTTGKGIDPDLKGQEIYEAAFEAGVTGFQLNGDTYTAYAAEGGSYTIEAEVTDLTSGKILTARNTVTVQELPKEAWRTTDNTITLYAPKLFVDGNGDGVDDVDGLLENDHYSLPWLDQAQYDELDNDSIKPGFLSNADEVQLKEEYTDEGGYNGNSTTEGATVLMTASPAAILANDDAIIAAAAPNALADAKDIIRTTVKTEGTAVDPTDETTWGDAGSPIQNPTLFEVGPDYSGLPGQDAYARALTLFVGDGVKATYAVELSRSSKTLGFKATTSTMDATLYATMGGLFAGYVHEDGSIGEGYVLANRASRIVNNALVGREVKVQTYFGKNLIAEDNTLGDLDIYFTPLYGAGQYGALVENAPRDVDGDELLYTSFDTVVGAPDDGNWDFYTKQNEQVEHDEDFAHEGTYKVEFSYWFASATKETKEGTNFTVKNDLYVPGVTVKSQTLDSYSQDGWKEAVVSEVDLNNNEPDTYSVIDLVDKNGNRISDSKTAAHWVVIRENGIQFHKPLDRTFKLS